MVTEMFWTGALFGSIVMVFVVVGAVTLYTRTRGSITIRTPERKEP